MKNPDKQRRFKILYYSSVPFMDVDFPMVHSLREQGAEVCYIFSLYAGRNSGPLCVLKTKEESAIFKADEYEELNLYSNYIDLNNIFVINMKKKGAHPLNVLLYFKLLFRILKFKPDAINITWPLSGPEVILYLLNRRMVMTVHDPIPHSSNESRRASRQRALAFKMCKSFILLGKYHLDAFKKRYGIRKPILLSSLAPYDVLHCIKTERASLKTSGYVLFFGRASRYKGIDILLQSIPIVEKQNHGVRFVFAGKGEYPVDIPEAATIINRFISPEELVLLVKNCAFVVCPYRDATQSGVIYSAFAFGKCVIASEVGSLPETIRDGVNGLLVPPENPEALAGAITRVLNENGLLQNLEEGVRKYCLFHQWKDVARQQLDFIKSFSLHLHE